MAKRSDGRRSGMSPVFKARIVIIFVGVIVLGVGLHSHFRSDWASGKDYMGKQGDGVHRICHIVDFSFFKLKCPDIALEHFFVSMIIIFFILSLLGLLTSFLTDMRTQPFKTIDLIYHALGGILLVAGGIAYIMSAVQINQIKNTFVHFRGDLLTLRFEEKLAAGAVTIFQGLVYGVVTLVIIKS